MARTPISKHTGTGAQSTENDQQAAPSASGSGARPSLTKTDLFVWPDGERVEVFLQPDLTPALLENFQTAIESRGGYRVKQGDAPSNRGFIVVDPRTPLGRKYIAGDRKESGWRVVPYTFIRACIFKSALLEAAEFTNVTPVFEVGLKALKIHLHAGLRVSLSDEQLNTLKLQVTMHGGHAGAELTKAQVILTTPSDLTKLRNQYEHSPVHVEAYDWIDKSIRRGHLKFSEASPQAQKLPERDELSPGRPGREYSETEERYLVKLLAELYPEADRRRASLRLYKYIKSKPNSYPWATHHSEASWQNHYSRDRERFDRLIERYLDAHPELRVSESDAERKRTDLMGRERRRKSTVREGSDSGNDEYTPPKKRRKSTHSSPPRDKDDADEFEAVEHGEEDDGEDTSPIKTASLRSTRTNQKPAVSRLSSPNGKGKAPEKDEDLQSIDDEEIDQLVDDVEDSFPPIREAVIEEKDERDEDEDADEQDDHQPFKRARQVTYSKRDAFSRAVRRQDSTSGKGKGKELDDRPSARSLRPRQTPQPQSRTKSRSRSAQPQLKDVESTEPPTRAKIRGRSKLA